MSAYLLLAGVCFIGGFYKAYQAHNKQLETYERQKGVYQFHQKLENAYSTMDGLINVEFGNTPAGTHHFPMLPECWTCGTEITKGNEHVPLINNTRGAMIEFHKNIVQKANDAFFDLQFRYPVLFKAIVDQLISYDAVCKDDRQADRYHAVCQYRANLIILNQIAKDTKTKIETDLKELAKYLPKATQPQA